LKIFHDIDSMTVSWHGAKLPRKQEAAIAALLSHRTVEEAADGTGSRARRQACEQKRCKA
jgi:hypothetical protein